MNKLKELEKKIDSLKKSKIKDNKLHKSPSVNYSIAMNISIELITGIGLGVFLGLMIDNYLQTKPLMLIICFILGTLAGFFNMYKALKGINFLNKGNINWQQTKDLFINLRLVVFMI